MFKDSIKRVFNHLEALKRKGNLKIVDTHIHPYDVMGVQHGEDFPIRHDIAKDFSAFSYHGGILEFFRYGKIVSLVSPPYYRFFHKSVWRIIQKTFYNASSLRILDEMRKAHIDRCVLVPIEPWLSTDFVHSKFQAADFFLLGSIDVVGDSLELIKERLHKYIFEYKIIGLKLHPNLQGFKPQPSHNPPEVQEKLEYIYTKAAEAGLYVLFHGGLSFYTDQISDKYNNTKRSRTNALLKNYFNQDGSSEILGKYSIPVIFAHLGHFGLLKVDYSSLQLISKRYSNVYFDTSGTSPQLISKIVEVVGAHRVVFGSDGLYNRILQNLIFVYRGLSRITDKKKFDQALI